jgi:hypothetical protein
MAVQFNTDFLKVGALFFQYVGNHFLHDGQHVLAAMTGDPMGLINQQGRFLGQFPWRKRRIGLLLLVPLNQAGGQFFFLTSYEPHGGPSFRMGLKMKKTCRKTHSVIKAA